jgi:hypothetical protein
MNKLFSLIWCWLVGHDFVAEGNIDNGQSQFGAYRCIRCGKNHCWQYDYVRYE